AGNVTDHEPPVGLWRQCNLERAESEPHLHGSGNLLRRPYGRDRGGERQRGEGLVHPGPGGAGRSYGGFLGISHERVRAAPGAVHGSIPDRRRGHHLLELELWRRRHLDHPESGSYVSRSGELHGVPHRDQLGRSREHHEDELHQCPERPRGPGGTPITSWAWDFGDGGVSTSQNPNHIYLVGGTYTVSLTATNSRGSDTATKTNLIVATQSPVPPTAQFSGTPRSGNAPLAVQFTDQSTPGTSPITNRQWVFGDSATSSAQNPSHTYTVP